MTKNNEEMTDKQIIENKNGFYCIEPCSEIKQLKEQLKAKEQECEELKKQLKSTKGLAMLRYQCLEAIKELANNANLPNVGLYIDSFLNEISNKDENCHFDKIKELTKEQ